MFRFGLCRRRIFWSLWVEFSALVVALPVLAAEPCRDALTPDPGDWRKISIVDASITYEGYRMRIRGEEQSVEGLVIEHRTEGVWIVDRSGKFHSFKSDALSAAAEVSVASLKPATHSEPFRGVGGFLDVTEIMPGGVFFVRLPLPLPSRDPFDLSANDFGLAVAKVSIDRANRREPVVVFSDPKGSLDPVRIPLVYLEQFEMSDPISGFAITGSAWEAFQWPRAFHQSGFEDLQLMAGRVEPILENIRQSAYTSQRVGLTQDYHFAPLHGLVQLAAAHGLTAELLEVVDIRDTVLIPHNVQLNTALIALRDLDLAAQADNDIEMRSAVERLQEAFLKSTLGIYAAYHGLQESFRATDGSVFYLTTLQGQALDRKVTINGRKILITGSVGVGKRISSMEGDIEYSIERETRIGVWSLFAIRIRFY